MRLADKVMMSKAVVTDASSLSCFCHATHTAIAPPPAAAALSLPNHSSIPPNNDAPLP